MTQKQTITEWLGNMSDNEDILIEHNENGRWPDNNPKFIASAEFSVRELTRMNNGYGPINMNELTYDGSNPIVMVDPTYMFVNDLLNHNDNYVIMFEITNMPRHYVVLNLTKGQILPGGHHSGTFMVLPGGMC